MRILLDESVHAKLKNALYGHAVKTVTEAGWRGTKDAALLNLAQRSFDVLITIDKAFEAQQNLRGIQLALIIAHVKSNEISSYEPLYPALLAAVERAKPGQVIHVSV